MAVVISPEQYALFQWQERHELFETVRGIHDRNQGIDSAEIEAEIAEAVADVHREETAQDFLDSLPTL